MEERKATRAAYLVLTAMALCFAGTPVAGKVGVAEIPPFTLSAVRFVLGSGLLAAWAFSRGIPLPPPVRRDLVYVVAMGVTAIAGNNVLFLYGLRLAPASDSAILTPGLAPVFTAVLAWLVLGERMKRKSLVGLVAALGGLLLLLVEQSGAGSNRRLLGDLLFVGCAVLWAIYNLVGRPATARFGTVRATIYATLTGSTLLIPFAAAERGWITLRHAGPTAWAGLLYLAVAGTVLGLVLLIEGIRRVGPSRASAFMFLIPILGVLLSVLLLGDAITPATLAAGVLVLLGLWLVQGSGPSGRATSTR